MNSKIKTKITGSTGLWW